MIIYSVGYYDTPYRTEIGKETLYISSARKILEVYPWVSEIRVAARTQDMKDKNYYPAEIIVTGSNAVLCTPSPNGGQFNLAENIDKLPEVHVTPLFEFMLSGFLSYCSTVDLDLIEVWNRKKEIKLNI
jgi:hypothetical protein